MQKAPRITLSLYLEHMSQIRELMILIYKEHFKKNLNFFCRTIFIIKYLMIWQLLLERESRTQIYDCTSPVLDERLMNYIQTIIP